MTCSLGISNFLKRSLVFPILLCPLFLGVGHLRRLSYLSLLLSGTLHSVRHSLPFLLCLLILIFSFLFFLFLFFGFKEHNEAGQRLTEFCQENALVIANTLFQQHKRWLYMWTSPDGQYQNQTAFILCSQRWRSSVQSAKTRPRVDCGSDHQLLIAKCRLKLKKVGKATRPFMYDLNQISHVYTVEVKNRV